MITPACVQLRIRNFSIYAVWPKNMVICEMTKKIQSFGGPGIHITYLYLGNLSATWMLLESSWYVDPGVRGSDVRWRFIGLRQVQERGRARRGELLELGMAQSHRLHRRSFDIFDDFFLGFSGSMGVPLFGFVKRATANWQIFQIFDLATGNWRNRSIHPFETCARFGKLRPEVLASQSLVQIHSRLLVQQKTHLQNLQGITFFPMFFPWFFPSIAIFCGISTHLDLMSWNVLEPWMILARFTAFTAFTAGGVRWGRRGRPAREAAKWSKCRSVVPRGGRWTDAAEKWVKCVVKCVGAQDTDDLRWGLRWVRWVMMSRWPHERLRSPRVIFVILDD